MHRWWEPEERAKVRTLAAKSDEVVAAIEEALEEVAKDREIVDRHLKTVRPRELSPEQREALVARVREILGKENV